jgi:iron(III) transport system ATP-binding protein
VLRGVRLTRAAPKREILSGVSFEIPAGSTATVLGPSGSGKTTLLRTIMGLDRPDSGELYLGGRCLARDGLHMAPERRDISLVFQEFTLFPHLDVADNLTFGLRRRRAERTRVEDLLELLEIGHLKRRRIDRLSGGEQQRVSLARALAVRPRVLLMDEPFSNIDNMLRERLYRRLRARLSDDGMTTLIATHDHKEAFYFSDSILVLKDGRLIDHNAPRLIYQRPANAWVAQFFGETNILSGGDLEALTPGRSFSREGRYLVRPEAFDIVSPAPDVTTATVTSIVYYGAYQDLLLTLESGLSLRVRCTGPHPLREGERVGVGVRRDIEPHRLPAS